MKNIIVTTLCFLTLFLGGIFVVSAQCRGGSCGRVTYQHNGPQWAMAEKKQGKGIHLDSTYVYPEERYEYRYENQDDDDYGNKKSSTNAWGRKGFELSLGGNIYFASKKTANYYNGAPENNINLKLLFKNEHHWRDVVNILKNKYHYLDEENVEPREDYNYNSHYNIAIDIAVAIKYRFNKNYYFELSYSFRRLTVSNRFLFDFVNLPDGNKENRPWSDWQNIVSKEDRHSIDLSVGYIFQKHPIAKPFLALGAQFTYLRIKDFKAVIEGNVFDLMNVARYPNYVPGVQEMPKYIDWAGVGYGFLFTAGLKIAVHPAVSLDPIFQLSVASFGNSKANLPGFHTGLCLNYIAGVRLVLNDALFMHKD